MKKVMSEEEKVRNRELMHEILDIVLDTNGFKCRRREKTGTLPTVFLRFSGHISGIDIDLHEDGWQYGASHKTNFEFFTDRPIDPAAVDELWNACMTALAEKTETDVLERDIENQERTVMEEKRKLSKMKKNLRRMKSAAVEA